MAEGLSAVQEAVDSKLEASLVARTSALRGSTPDATHNLGPPDLCYLTKLHTHSLAETLSSSIGTPAAIGTSVSAGLRVLSGALRGGKAAAQTALRDAQTAREHTQTCERCGFYHHVLGLDTSSLASIAAYFAGLLEGGGSSATSSTGWRVVGGVYCCWDAIRCVDLRVMLSVPGGVQAYLLDASGKIHGEISEQDWVSLGLCAALRAHSTLSPPPSYLTARDALPLPPPPQPCVREMPPALTPEGESVHLEQVAELLAALSLARRHQLAALVSRVISRAFGVSRRSDQARPHPNPTLPPDPPHPLPHPLPTAPPSPRRSSRRFDQPGMLRASRLSMRRRSFHSGGGASSL